MGPKRARASSSQNPALTPQERREARRRLFESRPVNPGRPVVLTGLDRLGTAEAFANINWGTFLNFEGVAPYDFMIEFYAGYDFNATTRRVSVQIFDHSYEWSLEQFSGLLGLTHSNINVFSNDTAFGSLLTQVEETQQTILQSVLRPEFRNNVPAVLADTHLPENLRFWNKVILYNVLGRAGNFDRLNALQCYILYCLRHGIHINATYIVAHRMVISEGGTQSLPFGYLIRNLFTNLQIPIIGRMLPPPVPIDDQTVTRMGVPAGPARHRRRHHQDPAPEEVDPYAVPEGAITNRQIFSAIMDFRRGYDADQREIHERLEYVEESLDTLTHQLDEIEFVDRD